MAVVLGCPMNSTHGNDSKSEALHIPGFQYLGWLLPSHLEISELYFLLTALMMGQPAKLLPADTKFDLDTVWAFLWGSSLNNQPINSVAPKINLCSEAVVVLLGMVRAMLHNEQGSLPEWLQNHTISIVQVQSILLMYDSYVKYNSFIGIVPIIPQHARVHANIYVC